MFLIRLDMYQYQIYKNTIIKTNLFLNIFKNIQKQLVKYFILVFIYSL